MPRKKSYQWQAGGNADNAEAPSRSAKKRQSLALQALGEELTRLSPAELQHLDPVSYTHLTLPTNSRV